MIIIVDTNILFSACLSPSNKIAEILFSPLPNIERISCYYTIAELFKHQPKIVELSKQPVDKVSIVLYNILKQVEFFNEKMIDSVHLTEAVRLTSGIDTDDIAFVALTLQKDGWLWTGDEKLVAHLRAMGFDRALNTNELYNKLEIGT